MTRPIERTEGDPIHVARSFMSDGGDPWIEILFMNSLGQPTGVSLREEEAYQLMQNIERMV
jgi:hypothetical protein